jgi:calcineurin-like phosphoesterase family protein
MSDNVWATSDEHYGHANIITFCNRPFANTEEMREGLIERHNSVVRPGDRVIHLGDMFWRTTSLEEALAIRYRLNGQHYYILGNHEERMRDKELRESFIWVRDVENLKIKGYPHIWLSHYAHRVWHGSHRGAYHLYGHTHNNLPEDGSLSMDVGVDAQNFLPISLDAIHAYMQEKIAKFDGKRFRCTKCDNNFHADDSNPKTCAKCTAPMELR